MLLLGMALSTVCCVRACVHACVRVSVCVCVSVKEQDSISLPPELSGKRYLTSAHKVLCTVYVCQSARVVPSSHTFSHIDLSVE